MSLYGYVENNPCRFVDPSGLLVTSHGCRDAIEAIKESEEYKQLKAACEKIPGCKMPELTCERIGKRGIGGGFKPRENSIVLYYLTWPTVEGLQQGILHELIHHHDHKVGKAQLAASCEDLACSEIRAYSMSGNCDDGGSHRKPNESRETCVRREATESVMGVGLTGCTSCYDALAAVDQMWASCYRCEKCSQQGNWLAPFPQQPSTGSCPTPWDNSECERP